MDSDEFDKRYMDAFTAVTVRLMLALDEAQKDLYALAATLLDEAERERARNKVYRLPTYIRSEPMSLHRREAERVFATADLQTGTKEERLAAIAATRKKVWEIADRAGDDADRIRYMTRRLDCSETELLNSECYPWNDDYDSAASYRKD
jgi:hypothetical protein